jgi:hypothetical protein
MEQQEWPAGVVPQALLRRLEEAVTECILDQFRAAMQAELLHGAAPVGFDGLGADVEAFADLAAAVSLGGEADDLALAGREVRVGSIKD